MEGVETNRECEGNTLGSKPSYKEKVSGLTQESMGDEELVSDDEEEDIDEDPNCPVTKLSEAEERRLRKPWRHHHRSCFRFKAIPATTAAAASSSARPQNPSDLILATVVGATATTVEDSGRRLPFPASPFSCNGEAALGGELGVVWQSSEQQLWTSIFPSPARMLKQSPLASSDDSAAASLSGEEPLIRFFSDVGRRRHRSSAMVISHPSSQVVSFPSLFPRQCSSGVGRWRSWRKLPVDAPVSPPRSNGNAMGGGGMSATISSKVE
nr:hypothetical protein Iba_chr13dCG5910 [Ipomoea batatas]